jgi:hypothetical protein
MRLATSEESSGKAIKKFAMVADEWVNLPYVLYLLRGSTRAPSRASFMNAAESVIFSNEL